MLASQERIQWSSECAGTEDWWKRILRAGSRPMARKEARRARREERRELGGWREVKAWRSTMEKRRVVSGGAEFCMRTHCWRAPR